jgi:ankyrin repeat protein
LKDSKKGQVPIHFIRNLDFGKYLVSLGADVSIADNAGNTIVHKADSF